MNEITSTIRFLKKRGALLLVGVGILAFAVIGLFAWSGVTTREQIAEMQEQTLKVATELGKINRALNP